ncbi:type II toxin-antitoxin system ParD family antitoxin [bacterium DOLZORAL124_64_63]|nr:MAG: type II toxin-antitoxin system ParD family antitoxin [bacterium DOLZORAL124_64_63]
MVPPRAIEANVPETFFQHESAGCQKAGRSIWHYGNASEVIRAAMRLLEEHEQKIEALRLALDEGEASGDAGKLNFDEIKRKARKKAGFADKQ